MGLPKWKHSVTVLLPPCVITRSTWGRMLACGRNSSPRMLSASSNSSCCGPFETMNRCGESASVAHHLDVCGAQAAEAEVDERAVAVATEVVKRRPFRIRPAHARVEPVPRVAERMDTLVVRFS